MPEYLTPGVYVEEVSFRSKSIEGVATSTTGFVAVTRYGPVAHAGGPTTNRPRLITNFREFEEVFGGLEDLEIDGGRTNYAAHAARAFFMNGGQRLYVARVYAQGATDGVARRVVPAGGGSVTWSARWPGRYGEARVDALPIRTRNLAYDHGVHGIQVRRAKAGAVVEIFAAGATVPGAPRRNPETGVWEFTAPVAGNLRRIEIDSATGRQRFMDGAAESPPAAGDQVVLVELQVQVQVDAERTDVYDGLGVHPDQTRYIGKILGRDHPEDDNAVVWLDLQGYGGDAAPLLTGLVTNPNPRLAGGSDGQMPAPAALQGSEANPDDPADPATGLYALEEIEDIAIIAAPDGSTYDDEANCLSAQRFLIESAERSRFRIAVVDGRQNSSMSGIRGFRGQFDSSYAAIYHPWIEILDPTQPATKGAPPPRITLPPSGFVAGIYARTDVRRGVHKAPANEMVQGLSAFESNINDRRQAVLNPEGINALRFFDGRGHRVWGARTMSSDPEWKYVNVRRLFIYLEHSIYRSTQWAVFEPNNERLWANIRETVSDFLYTLWRDGALMGTKPDQAYFVRCDRTTMSQNDLDSGRMICQVGIAPAKPAEFVIFRVGQWTGDAATS